VNRILVILVLSAIALSVVGCHVPIGTQRATAEDWPPVDPIENLKWHVSHAIREGNSSTVRVGEAKTGIEVGRVMAKADKDAFATMLFKNPESTRDFYEHLMDDGKKWYREKYVFDDNFKCTVTRNTSALIPYTARVEIKYKSSCTNVYMTKDEAERAPMAEKDAVQVLEYVYRNSAWALSDKDQYELDQKAHLEGRVLELFEFSPKTLPLTATST
jgi:hypothetical protein